MNLFIKSIFDVTVSLFLFVLLFPVFVIFAVLIKIDIQGPIFFKQERCGKDGTLFTIYKFRTMVENAVNLGTGLQLCENDPRITKVGNFLRKWSLDELPQLINIIKGDMSIVGPRPTLQYQVDQYDELQRKRLLMKPGVTGWAQVNGRNSLSWEKRIELDIWYIENYSLWLNIKILFKTVGVAVLRDGLYGEAGVNDDFNLQEIPRIKKSIS